MDEEMDGSYSSAPVRPPGEGSGEESPGAEKPKSVDEENAEEAQILVNKSELPPGTKEGDTCTFEVVQDHGDEFSLRYVKEDEESREGSKTSENLDADTASEISALDQKG